MPMTVEYKNGVQSSTISYSNMVIPEGIINKLKSFCVIYVYCNNEALVDLIYLRGSPIHVIPSVFFLEKSQLS